MSNARLPRFLVALFLILAFVGGSLPAFAASATFLYTDTSTAGNWKGVYGQDGYVIALDSNLPPAYATVSTTNAATFPWAASTTLPKALLKSSSLTDRIGSTYYPNTGNSFDINVNLTDGQTHQVTIYSVDWEPAARVQTVSVLDAANPSTVLNTVNLSAFGTGVYTAWNIQGNVIIRVTQVSGQSAVVSGVFFGAGTPASVTITNPSPGTVSGTLNLTATATAAVGVQSVQFKLDGSNVGAPVTTGGPSYTRSWDSSATSNGPHNLTAVVTDLLNRTTTSAGIAINVLNAGPPPPSATFVRTDIPPAATAGNWKTLYGQDGHIIPNEPFNNNGPSYLSQFVQTKSTGGAPAKYAYLDTPGDTDYPRAMQWAGTPPTSITQDSITIQNPTRNPSVFYDSTSVTAEMNFNDAQIHQVALYLTDFDSNIRNERITIMNGDTNATLDTRDVVNFQSGQYFIWNLRGHIKIKFDNLNSSTNLVYSAFLFGGGTPAPTVTITQPASGPVSGTVTIAADATTADTIASVQFQLDGSNLGAAVTTAPYQISWPSNTVISGSHALTAIATDSLGQSSISPGVTITVNNPPPAVSITSPSSGQTELGTVTIQASAVSATSQVVSLQFLLDGSPLGSPILGAGPIYSYQWDTNTATNGNHTLAASATDVLGQTALSANVPIVVSNGGPTVTLTAPSAGPVTGTVTMTALTAQTNAPVASVQFQVDGQNYGALQVGSGPNFSLALNTTTIASGNHTLRAVAKDTLGQSTNSAGVIVSISNPPPVVSMSSPADGSSAVATITISATATSPTSTMTSVQFTVDGNNIGAAVAGTGPNFSKQWATTTITNGAHTLTAVATDSLGQTTTSAGISVTVNNPPPVISITNPVGGATVSGALTVAANATSTIGMASVQFKLDGNNLNTVVNGAGPSFTTSWLTGSASNGPHTLTAVATDTQGQTTTSASVIVTVTNSPPTVSITNPTNNSTIAGPITLTATASSATSTMASVQYKVDGNNIGTPVLGTGPTFSLSWSSGNVTNGAHTLTAVATDSIGLTTTSAPIAITVNNPPPTVTITQPTGAFSLVGTVTITANAASSIGLASVQFMLDGATLGNVVNGTGPNFSMQWLTTTASNGAHVLTAVATDTQNQTTTSNPLNVNVSNGPPPPPSAAFLSVDTNTKGNWKNVYGKDGYIIANDASNPPPYVTVTSAGATPYTWLQTTADPRALLKSASATDRIASTFYTNSNFTYDLNFIDGQVHQIGIYALDLEGSTRNETVSILNADTNVVLNSQTLSNFNGGIWALWSVQGKVRLRIAYNAGLSAVASGIFFDTPVPPPPPPTVSIISPAPGTVSGVVNLSATASSAGTMASVQFQVDGVNVGAPVAGTGPSYGYAWDSTTIVNGPHLITAVAKDSLNQTTTSAGVSVTTTNVVSPPVISITAPGAVQVSGTINVTATATGPGGITSVQFLLDGANLGAIQNGSGPNFSIPWNTLTASNAPHTLSAVAKDALNQQTTSAGVAVTVNNVAPSATFMSLDTTTKGNWKGVYGTDGYLIPNDSNNPPVYATITGGGTPYTWNTTTTDPRALLKGASGTDRIASVYYTSTNYTFDINITDSQTHQLALYMLDIDTNNRAQTISIMNANTNAVLSTQAMSNFNGGVYAIWNVTGHILVKVTYTGGLNAVVSGLFLKTVVPPPPPPVISITGPAAGSSLSNTVTLNANATATAGMSSVQFKVDGVNIGTAVAGAGPGFTKQWDTTLASNGSHTLTAVATDAQNQTTTSAGVSVTTSNVLAPPVISITAPSAGTVSGTVAVTANATATAGMSSVQFKLDGASLGSPVNGAGPTYTYQWNTIPVSAGPHTLTAVATDAQNQTTTAATVNVTVANIVPAAVFVSMDTTTKGNWKGVYGADGSIIPADSSNPASYATITGPTGGQSFTWAPSTTDSRGLLKAASLSDRIASTFYSNTNFTFDVTITDGQTHRVALYFWDFEGFGRTETITILDANTNAVLETKSMSNFGGGVYALFNIGGHVLVRITNSGVSSAVLSGLFLSTPPPPPAPPVISVTAPAGGSSLSGTVTVTANATAAAGMTSVQFKIDNNNIGSPVAGSGPIFNTQWNTTSFTNGAHTITAVATDAIGQTTTSAVVNVTASNPVTPPAVSITAPLPGTVSGTVQVTATATAPSGMASVQFKLDGTNLGGLISGPGPSFSYQWDSTGVTGNHVLTAVATDTINQNTTSAGVNVTVSNTAPAATFVTVDTGTKGNWKGVYGSDGYIIANDSSSPPSYASVTGPAPEGTPYTWAASTTDVRALIKGASATDRIASTFYSTNNATPFTFDVNITDGQTHQLALYMWDLENGNRAQTINILNANTAAVLATKAMSGFSGGSYAVFNVAGHVLVRVTFSGGINAVISGLFFKTSAPPPPPPAVSVTTPSAGASLSGTVTLTANATASAGMTSVQFKVDGNNVGAPVNGTGPIFSVQWNTTQVSNATHLITAVATDAVNQVTTSAAVSVTTTNALAPPVVSITAPAAGTVSGTVAVTASATATAGMSSVQFQLDGANLGAPVPGAGPNFVYQWDTTSSTGAHTLTAIATDALNQTTTSAAVNVTVNNVGPSATFISLDTTTKGSWKGVHGGDGYLIPGDSSNPPAYAGITGPTGGQTYVWAPSTTDVRALIKGASSTDRIASTYYSNTNFTFDVNLLDTQTHQIALYIWDFENFGRAETVSILNANTNAVLATTPMSNFGGGVYALFNITGHVLVRINNTGAQSAVLSGLFFKTLAPPPPPPVVSIFSPGAGANLSGTVTINATATANAGMASVQFKVDGNNIGSPVLGTGPTFSAQWNTANNTNGSHTLTAVATDALTQSTTSASVTVTTTNVVTPPTVSITAPAAGTVSGTVTVTANATATAGMANVQFKLDGANLGAPVAGSGPNFNYQWDTTSATGAHTLTAVATDLQAQVTTSAGVNVTVSNTGPSAAFLSLDTTTKGNWKGVYGTDGYIIPNDSNVAPSYATTTLPGSAGPTYTWVASTTDVKALLKGASATDRIASTYYSANNANPFTFNVNATDGQTHQLALYLWDLENSGRAETITILNASTNAVLATKAMSGFSGGVYAVFSFSGNVLVRFQWTGGQNAVVSGLFFKTLAPPPPPPVASITSPSAGASLTGTVTLTANATAGAGMSSVQFKVDGVNIGTAVSGAGPGFSKQWDTSSVTNGTHSLTAVATDAANQTTTTAAVSVSTSNAAAPPVVSITAPTAGNVSGIVTVTANATATAGIASVQFKLNGNNLGSAQTGAGPSYSVQWDTSALSGAQTLTAIATDTLAQFTTSAPVNVSVAVNTGPAATFVKLDTTTKGNWKGVYGADGYIIPNDSNSPPGYAIVGAGGTPYTWFASTTDVRALLKGSSSTDRIGSTFYSGNASFTIPVNLTDGQMHQVAIYALDMDTTTRNEIISILDAGTNAVLATKQISGFNGGQYLVFNVRGNVLIRVANNGGSPNIILNGIFFRSFNGLLPPAVNVTNPTGGTISGPVTITASATSAQGISSVQFQIDGVNFGAAQTGAGPNYSVPWATPAVSNGVHTITAIATDNLGLTSTSPAFNVTVSNGPPPTPSATFLNLDTTTSGSWVGVYGQDGYMIANNALLPPFYASVNLGTATQFTWNAANPTTDIPGLMKSPTNPERIGSTFLQPFTVQNGGQPVLYDINLIDYQQHRLALYFLDWHHDIRTEKVEILNGDTDAVLDTRTINAFSQGKYLVYNLQGHIKVKVTMIVTDQQTTADSTVQSGLFFGQ